MNTILLILFLIWLIGGIAWGIEEHPIGGIITLVIVLFMAIVLGYANYKCHGKN